MKKTYNLVLLLLLLLSCSFYQSNESLNEPEKNDFNSVAAKSVSSNLIVNGSFSDGTNGWTMIYSGTASGTHFVENGTAKLSIDNSGSNVWEVWFRQYHALEAGQKYTITFDIKASQTPKTFEVLAQKDSSPYTEYGKKVCTITANPFVMQSFSYSWVQPVTDSNARVGFRLGTYNDRDVWIDNVTLVKDGGNDRQVTLGLHPGSAFNDIMGYENGLGVKFDHKLLFQFIKSLNYSTVKQYLDLGYEPIINIEFMDNYANLKDIANGVYDHYLNDFIDDALADGNRPFWVRTLHEFNGFWYPWNVYYVDSAGNGQTITDFKNAWIHVVNLFRSRGVNVKFQMNYNMDGKPNTPFVEFYPGDAYVDMICVTCYNRAGTDDTATWDDTWRLFDNLFSGPYNQIVAFTSKPIGIAETSTTSHLGGDKPAWIKDTFTLIASKYTQVEQINWFFENKSYPEGFRDWDLNTQADKNAFIEGYNFIKNY